MDTNQALPEEFVNMGTIEIKDGQPFNFTNKEPHTCKDCGHVDNISLFNVKETIRKSFLATPIPPKLIFIHHDCQNKRTIMYAAIDYNQG